MSVADKILLLKSDFDAVYNEGYNKAESVNPMFYMDIKDFQWNTKAFPEGFDFVLKLRDKPSSMNAMLMRTKGLKSVTLICDAEGTTTFAQLVRETPIITLDLSNFKPKPNNISYMCMNTGNLVSIIGALDLSSCTQATLPFNQCSSLEDIEFVPNTIPMSISFSYSTNLTHDSLMSIINGLMDYGVEYFEYDITNIQLPCMTADQITNGLDTYTITNVGLTNGEGEIYTKSVTTGKTVGFYCHSGMITDEEILKSFKIGAKFIIDATVEDITYEYTYNSFKVVSAQSSGTTQTLTLGTTNLNKLTDEEKAIATEKGWTLA